MHLCTNCGEKVNDECRFCPECGALQSGRSHINRVKHKSMHRKNTAKVFYKSKTIPFNANMRQPNIKKAIKNPIIIGALIGLLIIIIALGGSYF